MIDSLGFPRSTIIVCEIEFCYFVTILVPLVDFSFLITLANISIIMINNNENSGHPYLVPGLSRNASSVSSLNKITALVLTYKKFIILRKFPTIPIFLSVFFFHE